MADRARRKISRPRCHRTPGAEDDSPEATLDPRDPLSKEKFMEIQNTVAVNYAGVPALALPVPLATGDFPVTSLQLVGPAYGEADLPNIGRLLESSTSLAGKQTTSN